MFCDMMPCNLVEGYQNYKGTYCFHLQGGSFIQNLGTCSYPLYYIASCFRRTENGHLHGSVQNSCVSFISYIFHSVIHHQAVNTVFKDVMYITSFMFLWVPSSFSCFYNKLSMQHGDVCEVSFRTAGADGAL